MSTSAGVEIDGFREAVLIVRAPEPHLAYWLDVGGWVLRDHGAVDARLLRGWGLPKASGQEWLLGHPDVDTGFVRLLRLDEIGSQRDVRADDQCWDSGGIFDLNVRVPDVAAKAAALRSLHWHGASPPIAWDFGPMSVKEWLVRGPDNVRLALIERVSPPLQGFDHMRAFSQVFNSSQIVRDMSAAVAFYCDTLGFRVAMSYDSPGFPPGPNVFGLPPALAAQVGLSIRIVHPQGRMEGSIELVTVTGAGGLDLSADAGPPHFGMAALRLPVRGIEKLAERLANAGHVPAMPLARATLAPYGELKLLAVRSPDGAWIEFFEPVP